MNRGLANTAQKLSLQDIFVIGFALFAMFFGAGNLIFPVMVGANAGGQVVQVATGLLLTSVALPVLGMIALATQTAVETKKGGLPSRIGQFPGAIFTLVVFLSTGMLYAVPRVATVAYEMSTAPLIATIQVSESAKLFWFTLIFFAVTAFYVLSPSSVIDRVGKYLSPALLVFLAILVGIVAFTMPNLAETPSEKWAQAPFVAGLIEGYNTMDALAAFVFGVVIVHSLKKRGIHEPRQRVREMAKLGIVAGVCLALVYIGLTIVGTRQAGLGFENGAQLLAAVSHAAFGALGQIIFSIITILACLTTAIGLLTAATEYYKKIIPGVPFVVLLAIQIVISISLANMGLTQILAVVAPLMQCVYPVAIVIIFLAIFEWALPVRLYFTYRLGAAVAAFISIVEASVLALGSDFWIFARLLAPLPLAQIQMAWLLPTLGALLIGFVLDLFKPRLARN